MLAVQALIGYYVRLFDGLKFSMSSGHQLNKIS